MKEFQEKYKTLYFAFFLFATVVIVTVIGYIGFSITNPIIEANNVKRIEDNIALLFSAEDGYTPFTELDSNSKYAVKNYKYIIDIYEVLNSEGEVHAVIYNVWAQGRNNKVNALIAIDPYTDTVVGVVYYKHGETPNIGEKHTRDEAIEPLIGQSLTGGVIVDEIAGATVTWGAINNIFSQVLTHYQDEEVHIDGN